MQFGSVPLAQAEGALLVHATRTANGLLKKGHRLTAADIEALAAAGLTDITVARLEPGDVDENTAAQRLAKAAAGSGLIRDGVQTGRVNLHAEVNGVLVIDRQKVDAMNRIDPALTFATLPEFAAVKAGRMVATAKIIPYAVAEQHLAAAELAGAGAIRVAPYRPRRVGLVATLLPQLKPVTMDKTRKVLERRLEPSGSTVIAEHRVPHDRDPVAEALAALKRQGADFFVLFGASAIADRRDVLPAAIEQAGGRVIHFGMPVDPGNLMLLGELEGMPVIGAPGCARSPAENGFDWVLNRLLAGLPVTPDVVTGLGVGGLLMEIASRPQPRQQGAGKFSAASASGRYGGIILAAGSSSRMAGGNKLLAQLEGKSVVRHVIDAADASYLEEVIMVTGHMAERVSEEADGSRVRAVINPGFDEGMASSIRLGLRTLPEDLDGVVILLGDMPRITGAMIDALIAAHDRSEGRLIVLATAEGKRGNPVLIDTRFREDLMQLQGDTGARHLIGAHGDVCAEVELGRAARLDLDTRESLAAEGGVLTES
ncbi:molybdopterin-binding/glycosyltransferase family 2 protein [Pannonibacter sp. Pt2]|uniref:Molybdopterin-binding/glycosyltransferase family 2 protein n=1 Tax=Pannonibacter anstelovis TaxID=3121537 RepID=A0ABU7ZMF9_9HYPH